MSRPSGAQKSGSPRPGPGLSGDVRHRALERLEIGRLDDRQEVLADAAQVGPRRGPQACKAAFGEDRLGTARIGRAGTALDEAVVDESIDQPRHAALAEEDLLREQAHPDPAAGRLGDGQQRVVLGERHVVLRPQLLVEAARDARMGKQEGSPRGEARIPRGQGSGCRFLDGHRLDATTSVGSWNVSC